jgi:hypothetical protein
MSKATEEAYDEGYRLGRADERAKLRKAIGKLKTHITLVGDSLDPHIERCYLASDLHAILKEEG